MCYASVGSTRGARSETARLHHAQDREPERGRAAPLAFCIWPPEKTTGRRTMRAIGLVLLSTALLLTDADAKRRSSARGSQAAGASRSWCATYPGKGISDNCGYSSFNQRYQTVLGLGGF